jgi:DNA-binding NarL/FixJ family response regulator
MTIRVLLADDQSMVRAGFRMLLSGEKDIEVVAEASNGLEATRRILAADNGARILILTTVDLDEYVYEALRSGASGFVLRNDPPEQLIARHPHGCRRRRASLTDDHETRDQRVRPHPPSNASEGLDDLSERERDVLRLIARGLSTRDRARALHQRDHRQDTRLPPEAQPPRPRPGSRARLQTGLFDIDTPATRQSQ